MDNASHGPRRSMLPRSVEFAASLIAQGRFADLAQGAAARIYRHGRSYGLRRDLTVPLAQPRGRVPIEVRPLHQNDVPRLFETMVSVGEEAEMRIRRKHLSAGIPQCYVAIDTRNGEPCFFQWLMGPEQNKAIAALFGPGWFPPLRDDEALVENAYTVERYRGTGVAVTAAAQISALAARADSG
jgi:hypothetical protein